MLSEPKYYIVHTTRYYDYYHDNKLSGINMYVDTGRCYRHEEPCYESDGDVGHKLVDVESYETLNELKSVIDRVTKLGCRTWFSYRSLCEADRKSLDEYIAKAKQKNIPETVVKKPNKNNISDREV